MRALWMAPLEGSGSRTRLVVTSCEGERLHTQALPLLAQRSRPSARVNPVEFRQRTLGIAGAKTGAGCKDCARLVGKQVGGLLRRWRSSPRLPRARALGRALRGRQTLDRYRHALD